MDWAEVLTVGVLGGLCCGAAALLARVLEVSDKYRGVLLAVGAGASVGLVGVARHSGVTDYLNVALGWKSQLEVDAADMSRDLSGNPRIRKAFEGKSHEEARVLGAELSRRGIPWMVEEDLRVWAMLNGKMAVASSEYCTARWKGGMRVEFFEEAFAHLSPEERAQWLDISKRAMVLALDHDSAPAVAPDALPAGFDAIFGASGPVEKQRALQDVARTDLTDERACELFRTIFSGADTLPGGQREVFLRALAQL